MTVYVVAQLTFKDRSAYDRYQASFPAVFRQHVGQALIADEDPTVREGRWDADKLVVLAFPDEEAAISFLESPAYREIEKDRKAGADAVVLLAKGVEGPPRSTKPNSLRE